MNNSLTLVVGVGSPHGDDQAGWRTATLLKEHLDHDDLRVHHASSPIQILDWLDGVECLIVCDACRGIGQAGELRRFEWPSDQITTPVWSGSHDFSLTASLQLAQRLGRLPQQVIIWAIEATIGQSLEDLSQPVAAAVPVLVDQIVEEIAGIANSRVQATCRGRDHHPSRTRDRRGWLDGAMREL